MAIFMATSMEAKIKEILINGSETLGIKLKEKQIYQFQLYLLRLKKWSHHINLTGIKTERDIVIKHFLDSLTIFSFLKPQWELLDIGTGAGFPGIPLKIALPSLKLTLVEAKQKKVVFLKEIKRLLELKDIEIIQTHLPSPLLSKKTFNVVVGRAVAPLTEYIRLALPYVANQGLLIIMRGGKDNKKEIEQICKKYNLSIAIQKSFMLPFSNIKREVIALKKLKS